MGFGQVVHVDVVANAGAIGRGVVGTENFQSFARAADGFKSSGNQMSFGLVEFPDSSSFIGSGGVEVAETYIAESVGSGVGLKRVLECQFCGSIGIHWITCGVFGDRNFVGYS